jgi:hypothetical protein
MTAGTLTLLQIARSRFLSLNGTYEQAIEAMKTWEDLPAQSAVFIFVHESSREDALKAIEAGTESFLKSAVTAVPLAASEVDATSRQITRQFFETLTHDNQPLQQPDPSLPKPAPDYPAWLAPCILSLAERTGWSYDFILWELPLAIGIQFLHHIHHGGNAKPQPTEPSEERLFQELESQLKGATDAR